jgi:hypothetical protein
VHDGPAAKKRKIENGAPAAGSVDGGAQSLADLKTHGELQFYMQDVSFAIPQRKKLTLEITAGKKFLRARNQASKVVEFGVPLDRIRMFYCAASVFFFLYLKCLLTVIEHVLCLPVPEKNQRQFNFCIIPRYADGINTAPEGEPTPETIVWTVNDGPPKAAFWNSGQQIENGEGQTAENVVRRVLNDNLPQVRVVRPDAQEFVSAMPEAHRKGEKAYHVKAFRGSKEGMSRLICERWREYWTNLCLVGYLFFLSTGIFFGFKKPLLFFSFETVESISYTSVLQRTFNLNVTARAIGSDETQEFEFSMIDQADYSGIYTYIKTHGLQDASLAEARRAKQYNINGVKTEENADGDAQGADESELQKAQRELEDQEDEEEEDYDPGSEGDSDGSGSSSEEDDDSAQEDDDDDEEDGNLVANELGSEAEDVPDDEL